MNVVISLAPLEFAVICLFAIGVLVALIQPRR